MSYIIIYYLLFTNKKEYMYMYNNFIFEARISLKKIIIDL